MNDYMFDEHKEDRELLRLRMIEDVFDSATIRYLQGTGLNTGWHCLELGAGAGSIMKWMGEVVGEGGRVVGVDKNVNHLRHLSAPPFQVIQGDFIDVAAGTPLDVAHCRYVLIHNRTGDEMLRKISNCLKPGGFLVVEEPDFTSAKLLNHNTSAAEQHVNNAICRLFTDMGLDAAYGLTLPEKVNAEGLHVVEVDSRIHLARGGSLLARMMGASTRALADKYVSTGEASESDIDQYIEAANDGNRWAIYYSTISVVAMK